MRKLVLLAAFCFFACGGPHANNPDGSTGGGGGGVCGDGKVTDSEQCDDGNTVSGDGCSADCQNEPGFMCLAPDAPCLQIKYCGDGVVQPPEVCDDGNSKGGDGCDGTCHPEPNFTCPAPGQPCVPSMLTCGDGKVQGTEQCDDGSVKPNDGCSSTCMVEAGWVCPNPGRPCIPDCGDGKVLGNEQCDLGPNNGQDMGCSATCTVQPGFVCPGNVCRSTVCGDGVKEGSEQCDDGNLIPYDGCSPTCTVEPKCTGGTCTAVCGDGLKFPNEECDDGNLQDGDGCSHDCKLESGFNCSANNQPPAATLVIPILYRDMLYNGTKAPPFAAPGHADFQNFNSGLAHGLVQATLGADGKPVWKDDFGDNSGQSLNGAVNFCWWYHDAGCNGATSTNSFARPVFLDAATRPTTLTLAQISTNVYQFNNQTFFPLDGLGWNAVAGATPQTDLGSDNKRHNFSFTSELHYPFTYDAKSAPKFDFTGDDDVWVFINGHLAVDLGGIHAATNGSVTLDAAHATQFGLVDGGMYSIDMFQAERHTLASTYKLTLSGFVHTVTTCSSICGDGVVVGNEQCDDGPKNGTSMSTCSASCTLVQGCGDGIKNGSEQCDNGTNDGSYGTCNPDCTLAPYCGDGLKNGPEQCDLGAMNSPTAYGPGQCTAACTIAPYCGDGIVEPQFGEQCEGGAGCFDCHYAIIQ